MAENMIFPDSVLIGSLILFAVLVGILMFVIPLEVPHVINEGEQESLLARSSEYAADDERSSSGSEILNRRTLNQLDCRLKRTNSTFESTDDRHQDTGWA
ncbi:hypothetical protein F4805DRAFT_455110 [Annulohypoxylon moriforme]|nr:hypothetical protein F4805DRAFT_455110 [Annulohypoxylon moriforme]